MTASINLLTCPPRETLKRYALGEYSDDEGLDIERHLSGCSSCDDLLAQFDDTNDSVIRHLPLVGINTGGAPPAPGWLQRLQECPPVGRLSPTAVIDGRAPAASGSELGAYELTGILGQGGMGVVYSARHRHLNRPVAVKVVSPKLVSANEAQRRFDREIRVLGALEHPGIVAATDAGRIGGAAYLVMERVDGIDLARLVQTSGPLSIGEACEIARQVALALSAAHATGAVHRDVKPSNLMVDRNGRVKLLDFGLAHLADPVDDQRDSSSGRLLGTLDYMPPEQLHGEPVGTAADLFGLGATLFHLLTGRPPRATRTGQSLLQQLRQLADEQPRMLDAVRADVPAELKNLVAQLLAREPADRPESATVVAGRLERWADPTTLEALVPPPAASQCELVDANAIAQSLSNLLGPQAGDDPAPRSGSQEAPGRGRRRPFGLLLARVGAAFAAVWLGIVLLIDTPEGTLRIESDVAGVQVEVLDEEDHVSTLEIRQGENETELKAGKYRMRLAGGHETLSISPATIILRSRGEQVARITRMKSPSVDGEPGELPAPDDLSAGSPLYEGDPARDWQRRFDHEVNPVDRIHAAEALVTIAANSPGGEQVAAVTRIGGRLLQAGWGEDVPKIPLAHITQRQFEPTRWSKQAHPDLPDAWKSLLELVATQLTAIPPQQLAENLTQQVQYGTSAEAAFVLQLLTSRALVDHIKVDRKAADVVLERLRRRDGDTLEQTCLLLRAAYTKAASDDPRKRTVEELKQAGEMLESRGIDETTLEFANGWIETATELSIMPDLAARVVLRRLVDQNRAPTYFKESWFSHNIAYPEEWTKQLQTVSGGMYDHWISAVNDWLGSDERKTPAQVARVVGTLYYVLRGREPDDDWDVEQTAKLLTVLLRDHYMSDTVPTANPHNARLGMAVDPHDLLAYIILCGGEVPPFVKLAPPLDDRTREQLRELLLTGAHPLTHDQFLRVRGKLKHLAVRAPYHTVKTALETAHLPAGSLIRLLYYTSTGTRSEHPVMEPLLLLALATELTGISEEGDLRISTLLSSRNRASMPWFQRHLDDALSSPYTVRKTAEHWLRRMRERSTIDELSQQIDQFLPRTSEGATPKSTRESADGEQFSDSDDESNPRQQSPEFPPVSIKVQSKSGEPLVDSQVAMVQLNENGILPRELERKVIAEDQTDHQGTAINRVLPYGQYLLKIETADGWTTYFRSVTVQFDKGLNGTIVAPNPGKRATLVVECSIDASTMTGLTFGVRQEPSGPRSAGYAVPSAPEPGDAQGRTGSSFRSFPTLGNGVSQPALQLEFDIVQSIEQPDGSMHDWRWGFRNQERLPNLLLSGTEVTVVKNYEAGISLKREQGDYFTPEENDRYDVGYLKVQAAERTAGPVRLEVATGNLEIKWDGIFAKADGAVVEALGAKASDDQEVWLGASINAKSAWVSRILDLDGWERGTSISYLARMEKSLEEGKVLMIKVRSPPGDDSAPNAAAGGAGPEPEGP